MIGMRPSFRYAGDNLSENALCNAGRDALFLIPGAQSPAVKLAAFARRFAPLAKRSGKRCPAIIAAHAAGPARMRRCPAPDSEAEDFVACFAGPLPQRQGTLP